MEEERTLEAFPGPQAAAPRPRRRPRSALAPALAPDGGSGVVQGISPLAFAKGVLQVELWSKQEEVLAAIPQHRRVAVKSGNGLGKGFCAAVAVLWFVYSHDPAIVLSTAPTFRQVEHVLWRQVRRLHRRAADTLGGKMLGTRWELADDRYAMGLSAETADQFQGFHSPNMLIVVDEAEGVSEEIYEAIEATMTSEESRLLLLGNPTTTSGAFRRAFYQERRLYHGITISALESPNVLAGKAVIAGLVTARWQRERLQVWGQDNPLYQARVLGEFPDQGEDTLIKLSDIEAAARRDDDLAAQEPVLRTSVAAAATNGPDSAQLVNNPPGRDAAAKGMPGPEQAAPEVVLAVDVARFGADRSVVLRRREGLVEEMRTFQGLDTMQLAGWVAAAIQEFQPNRVYVDEVGVGGGVVDRLREQGYRVQGINVGRPAQQSQLFANLRAEGYWRLRELFASGALRIPQDAELMGELAALRFGYDSQGRVLLESKDTMRSRGLPSPDKADALMMSFLEQPRVKLWT